MIVRITEPTRPAFQLRKGEEGISVFDLEAVEPPLAEDEVLSCFRGGSCAVAKTIAEIERRGLRVVRTPGTASLPQRLREAHAEIRPGPEMTRTQFKRSLLELEEHGTASQPSG
jgi:hypothetical protein